LKRSGSTRKYKVENDRLTGLLSAASAVYTAPDEHCYIFHFSSFGRCDAWDFRVLRPAATAATAASANR
jgi:hypothetical protein